MSTFELPPVEWDDMSLFEQLALLPEGEADVIIGDLVRRGVDLTGPEVMLRRDQLEIVKDKKHWISVVSSGRGWGKTRTGAGWVNERAEEFPGCQIILLGRTVADVRDVMVNGASGIIETAPRDFVPTYTPSLRRLEWPNGSTAMTFCATEDTEVFTLQHGWVTHDRLTAGDVVLTLNHETGLSEWQPCEAVHRFEVVDEPVVRTEMSYHSSCVTVGHRWPVIDKGSGARRWRESILDFNTKDAIITGAPCATLPTKKTHSDALVELVAWWTTEGHLANWSKPDHHRRIGVITQLPGPNADRISSALDDLYEQVDSLKDVRRPAWRKSFDGRVVRWFLSHEAILHLTTAACVGGTGEEGFDKVVRHDFIMDLTAAQLETYVNTFFDADGSMKSSVHGCATQKVDSRLDSVEAACHLLGWPTRRDHRYFRYQHTPKLVKPGYKYGPVDLEVPTLTMSKVRESRQPVGVRGKDCRSVDEYTGIVWCPQTPNRTWFARHEGTVFYTGNSADSPSQLRGPQGHFAWSDELAAFPIKPDSSGATAWDNCLLATRLGDHPQLLVTTTPKRTGVMRDLYRMAENDKRVTLLTASTLSNRTNLSPEYLQAIFDRYAGTHLEMQELFGELVGDAPGALWRSSDIVLGSPPEMDLRTITVIGVDPAVEAGGDNTGIVLARGTREPAMSDRKAWVLEDRTMDGAPDEWASEVHALWVANPGSVVVVEGNQGGQLLKMVLHQLDPSMPVAIVKAITSKSARAEPIVMAYRQRRVQHIANFPLLEEEMTGWEPEVSRWSPGSVDALVWALSVLLVDERPLYPYMPVMPGPASVETLPGLVPSYRGDRAAGMAVAPWRRH